LNLGDDFPITAELLSGAELAELVAKCKQEIDVIFQNLSQQPFVLFNRFSSAAFSTPVQFNSNIGFIEQELNNYLTAQKHGNIYLVEMNTLVRSIGQDNAFDQAKFKKYKSLYKIGFLKLYVSSIENLLLRRTGKLKK